MSNATSRFTVTPADGGPESEKPAVDEGDVGIQVEFGDGYQKYGTGDDKGSDTKPIVSKTPQALNVTADDHLFLYSDDYEQRPRIPQILRTISNYSASIQHPPAQEEEDGLGEKKKKVVSPPQTARMGTAMGVYLPCIQNIFGVLFFIRLTWIVGSAGILESFFVVFICCCVTFLTSISMSAIATNGVVPAGGSYFMISRALGPEFGGAVGSLFYLGTSTAAAMYLIGAVEIFLTYIAPQLSLFGPLPNDDRSVMLNNFRVYGTILLIIVTSIVLVGVRLVNKIATVALVCVLFSIFSVFLGIFVNAGGKDLELCMLGNRILKGNDLACAKFLADGENKTEWWNRFCQVNETSEEGFDDCDPYFTANEFHYVDAIPGLASGVAHENALSVYLQEGEVEVGVLPDERYKKNYVLADMTADFFILLAIFFPSCTGIMAGSNRSGDLANAQGSIPVGTIAATLTTSAVYLSAVIFFGASIDGRLLRDKFGAALDGGMIVSEVAWPHLYVVVIGAFLSTLGAGIQSLTGAPRLLQALAKDNLIPFLHIFSEANRWGEPYRAVLLTALICELGIAVGDLDRITPIITMFFLMCYMFVNLACVLQSILKTPSWRPRFKYYHWFMSLVGVLLCIATMFISGWYFALAAMAIACVIYKYIEYKGAQKEWGDGMRGLALSAARYSLLRLEDGPPHVKNWRPQILVLCKLDENLVPKYKKLITFASQLKAGKGLTVVASALEGNFRSKYADVQAAKQSLKNVLRDEKVKGFCDVVVAKSIIEGLSHLVQTSGLGGLRHNAVIIGWPYGWRQSTDEKSWKVFLDTILTVSAGKQAILVPKGIQQFPGNEERVPSGTLDVWWIVHDGGMLMLLPFLLRQHKVWKANRIRIFTVAQLQDNTIQMRQDLKNFLYHLRIEAEVEVVEMTESDISAYTYERTLMMEQRVKMLQEMQLTRRESQFVVQSLVDKHHPTSGGQVLSSYQGADTGEEVVTGGKKKKRKKNGNVTFSSKPDEMIETEIDDDDDGENNDEGDDDGSGNNAAGDSDGANGIGGMRHQDSFCKAMNIEPDEANVRRMHTAVKLNEVIVNRSHDASLVILNLPSPPKSRSGQENYMEFLEVLTEGLERVLMVRGGGREVITIYS